MQFAGCHQPVQHSYCSENAIDWVAYNGNDMRNAICVDTKTLVKWPYCPFPIPWSCGKILGSKIQVIFALK